MSRHKREREAPEVGAMAGRVIRALVRRADAGDTEALEQLLALHAQIAQAVNDAGAGLKRFGYSYTELAGVAGITRQAARERFYVPDEEVAGGPAYTVRKLTSDTPSTPAIPPTTDTTEHDARMGVAL